MVLGNLFKKGESLIAIDIGSHSMKVAELDMSSGTPKLLHVVCEPLSTDVYSNNVIVKGEQASDQIHELLESHDIEPKRIVTAMPGPSVFTKKIKLQKMPLEELKTNIQFEAGNFIPHNIDAVKLDFHIIGETTKNQLDILVVAVKNEIIDSFIDCVSLAGLETAVVDVDYFALQNIFEFSYPEMSSDTVALINMGARYSSINICKNSESVFTGDMSIGGKQVTDTLETHLSLSAEEAEKTKIEAFAGNPAPGVADILSESAGQIAAELNRQLSFFWSASGADEGIDRILITGGGSLVPGLTDEIGEKTGLDIEYLKPFTGLNIVEGFDEKDLAEVEPFVSVALGLALRAPGDKIIPDYM